MTGRSRIAARVANATRCSGTALFLDQARGNFGDVGAVAPSSAVEPNPAFAQPLQSVTEASAVTSGPRTTVHATRIEEFESAVRYDVIISGLPFPNFTPEEVGIIEWRSVTASLDEAHRHRAVERLLFDYWERFDTVAATVWRNLPPAQVFDVQHKRTPQTLSPPK